MDNEQHSEDLFADSEEVLEETNVVNEPSEQKNDEKGECCLT